MDKEKIKIALAIISGRVNLLPKLAKKALSIEKEYPTKEDILFQAEKIIFEGMTENGLAI